MGHFKFTPILGEIPENTEWWTEKDWQEHSEYVERLKNEGKYLSKGEELTCHFKDGIFDSFIDKRQSQEMFSNFSILVPQADGTIKTYTKNGSI